MSSEEEKVDEGGGMTLAESNASLSLLGEGIDDSRTASPHNLLGEDFDDSNAGSTSGHDPVSVRDVANGGEIAASFSHKSVQSSKDPGKPPRPQGVQQRAASTDSSPTKHWRQLSTTEYSTLSALTDDGEEGVDLPTRKRTISWDANVSREAPEEAAQMFVETSHTAAFLPPLSPPISPLPPASKGAQRWGTLRTAFLNNQTAMMENPMESEAETAILRVLERTRKRDAAKAGNIMPHVPEATISAFQASSVNEEAPADKSISEASETRTSRHSAMSTGHKRTKTLESKLFDLGAQMDRLQQDKEDAQGSRERLMSGDIRAGHERLLSRDTQSRRGLFLSRDAPPEKGHSGDLLAKNAEILFRRPITKKDSFSLDTLDVVPPAPTMGVHHGDRKKTDGDDVIQEADESDIGASESEYDIEAGGGDTPQSSYSERRRKFGLFKGGKCAASFACRANDEIKEDFGYFWQFLKPRIRGIKIVLGITIFFVIVPAITIAASLFYTGNPILGREGASTSWLVLFLSRQAVTFLLAKATEAFIIDFLSLQVRLTVRLFGPMFTLLVVQSKGLPFILFSWGVFNFCFNSGENRFAQHWMFWQSLIRMFGEENPSGTITHSDMNYRINGTAVCVGFVIALKRLWWGLYLGKRSYLHYGDDLANTVKNMILISEVANLGKEIEKHGDRVFQRKKLDLNESREVFNDFFGSSHSVGDVDKKLSVIDDTTLSSMIGNERVIDEEKRNKLTGTLDHSQKIRLEELLGKWEEPETVTEVETDVSIASILQFRQMLAYMDEDYPFTLAYGPADRRETCVESAQKLYQRLLDNSSHLDVAPFESMSALALKKDGAIDTERMKDLIKLFRPDRQGHLTLLDFVKSCDTVYKEMRLLRASIANSGQIDRAFEIMLNVVFYVILAIIVLAVLGLDPLALFISISGIVLAFAFMIGPASSKYFEGILFILVRRPYDIGDRINVAGVEDSSSGDGCSTWFVQNVDLFTTTVRYAFTNEVATVANGSLAASRIINAKRSPKANVFVYMKFSVKVPYEKILVFKKSVEAFVKDRPREFRGMTGFRATHMANEKGYVEYVICLEHRESWQNIGNILQSKADVSSFCLEVSKKLNMTYTAPPLPVNLSLAQPNMQLRVEPVSREGRIPDTFENASIQTGQTPSSPDFQSIAAMFGSGGKPT